MMSCGFVAISREIKESPSYNSKKPLEYRALLFTLYLRASFKESVLKGIKVAPGQAVVSVRGLAEELGLQKNTVHRMLKNMADWGDICIQNVGHQFTIVSLVNWHTYEKISEKVGHERDTDGTQVGQEWDTSGTRVGQLEEGNKGRREEREISSVAAAPTPSCEAPVLPGITKPVKAKKRAAVTLPASVEEVWAYIQSRESSCEAVNKMSRQEAERFFFYWDSKGWSDKSGPIKNWKSRLATWGLRSNSYDGNKNAHCGDSEHYNPFRLDA